MAITRWSGSRTAAPDLPRDRDPPGDEIQILPPETERLPQPQTRVAREHRRHQQSTPLPPRALDDPIPLGEVPELDLGSLELRRPDPPPFQSATEMRPP
jgi:hypothetical protein